MSRRHAIVTAILAVGATWIATGDATAASPVQLSATFDRSATLGSATALHAELSLDPRRLPSPVTQVRVIYPRGLGIVTGGLGLATCRRPDADFQRVMISGPLLGGCSPNAVLGYGTARAEVRVIDGPVIMEYATLTVLAGPIEDGALGLVVAVDGRTPFGAKLVYAGEIAAGPGPFGGALVFDVPPIPAVADLAVVALVNLRLSIGSRRIVYRKRVRGRTVRYRPEGVVLPGRCPAGGFRFRVQLAFQDGSRAAVDTRARCPAAASG